MLRHYYRWKHNHPFEYTLIVVVVLANLLAAGLLMVAYEGGLIK